MTARVERTCSPTTHGAVVAKRPRKEGTGSTDPAPPVVKKPRFVIRRRAPAASLSLVHAIAGVVEEKPAGTTPSTNPAAPNEPPASEGKEREEEEAEAEAETVRAPDEDAPPASVCRETPAATPLSPSSPSREDGLGDDPPASVIVHPTAAPPPPTQYAGFVPNHEQRFVIEQALRGRSMYIGGEAGTGKTALMRMIQAAFRDRKVRCAFAAPTWNAAFQLDGASLQQVFGVLKGDATVEEPGKRYAELLRRGKRKGINPTLDALVLDEISMVSAKMLDLLDAIARASRGDPRPFGGMQVIFVGDFLQLSPIDNYYDSNGEEKSRTGALAIRAEVWGQMFRRTEDGTQRGGRPACIKVLMRKNIRQSGDLAYLELLRCVKYGRRTGWVREELKKRLYDAEDLPFIYAEHGREPPKFFPRRNEADAENERIFALLSRDHAVETYEMRVVYGDPSRLMGGNDEPPVRRLRLCRDTRVIFNRTCKTNDERLCNGLVGSVVDFVRVPKAELVATNRSFSSPYPPIPASSLDAFSVRSSSSSSSSEPFRDDDDGDDDDDYADGDDESDFAPRARAAAHRRKEVETECLPRVEFERYPGQLFVIYPETWEYRGITPAGNEYVICAKRQIPLSHAWGISIHKGQGMTVRRAEMSLVNTFAEGHVYVALSRVTESAGLYLTSLPRTIKVSQEAIQFYETSAFVTIDDDGAVHGDD